MKKLAIIITIVATVGLTSCKKDYVCTGLVNGEAKTVTLSDDEAVACDTDGSNCITDNYTGSDDVTDKESAKDFLEDNGFTCK